MARLRIYTVHINPSFIHPYEAAEFVEEGFAFRAFLFSSLWAFYHKIWDMALLLLAYNFAVLYFVFYSDALSHTSLAVIDLGVHFFIGFEATEWLRKKLKKDGYVIADIATGDSPLGAEQRFFDRYFAKPAQV